MPDSDKLKTIRIVNGRPIGFFADGSKAFGYPTTTPHIFIVRPGSGGGTGPVDPGEGGSGFIQPFDPDSYDAADPFGASPGAIRNHFGSDWPMPLDSPIRSIGTGTVAAIGESEGNGNHMVVYYGNYGGREIYAGHIHLFAQPTWPIGTVLNKGQADIARTGSTGTNSGGPHLHITMSSSVDAWQGLGGIFDPHHFIETGEFIDRNW